ncbi:MAG: hypothetical protein J2P17_00575, partial [Mycobacterium sp.]|nr:hypothetical protein [Mycobacterium sp.]
MTAAARGASHSDRRSASAPDSVDELLAEWERERPDLDFSPVGIANRLARVRAHLDAGQLQLFRRLDLSPADF